MNFDKGKQKQSECWVANGGGCRKIKTAVMQKRMTIETDENQKEFIKLARLKREIGGGEIFSNIQDDKIRSGRKEQNGSMGRAWEKAWETRVGETGC